MRYQRLFHFGFWVLLAGAIWYGLGQCGQGRVSEAFAMSDAGIQNNRMAMEPFNKDLLRQFSSYVALNPQPENLDKAAEVQRLQRILLAYHDALDSIKMQLLALSGVDTGQPIAMYPVPYHNAAVRQVFLSDQPNTLTVLSQRTGQLREALIHLADSSQDVISAMPVTFMAQPDGHYVLDGYSGYLGDLPLTGALALLSELQLGAQMGLTLAMYHLTTDIYHPLYCCFACFLPTVLPRSAYTYVGDRFQADIFLQKQPERVEIIKIAVNGQPLAVADDVAHFEAPTSGIGSRTVRVDITGCVVRNNKEGYYRDTFQVYRTFGYEVGTATPELHQPAQRNYLYAGVENPVSFYAGDFGCRNFNLKTAGATYRNTGAGKFGITPLTLNPVTLNFNPGKFKIQVRPLPSPVPVLGQYTNGNRITREEIAGQMVLDTRFPEDFEFVADCQVIDFQLTRFRAREDPEEVYNRGGHFNRQIRLLLETALPGDRFFFEEIRVKCPGDTQPRTIENLALRVE